MSVPESGVSSSVRTLTRGLTKTLGLENIVGRKTGFKLRLYHQLNDEAIFLTRI